MAYTDSLLQSQLPVADSLLKHFKYVKNEKYEDNGYYIRRELETSGLGQRIFLQAYVTDNFKTVVRSFYYGSRTLEHGTIELDADDVTNSFTGHCHVFNEEGNHEITTLDNDQAVNLRVVVNAKVSTLNNLLTGEQLKPATVQVSRNRFFGYADTQTVFDLQLPAHSYVGLGY